VIASTGTKGLGAQFIVRKRLCAHAIELLELLRLFRLRWLAVFTIHVRQSIGQIGAARASVWIYALVSYDRSTMEILDTLRELGIELPGTAYVVGVCLFSVVGMVAFWKGRKLKRQHVKWLGVVLMFYPYFVWNTVAIYGVGIALCIALWVYRRS